MPCLCLMCTTGSNSIYLQKRLLLIKSTIQFILLLNHNVFIFEKKIPLTSFSLKPQKLQLEKKLIPNHLLFYSAKYMYKISEHEFTIVFLHE